MILAALAWVLLHVVVAGPLRPGLVRRLGLPAYRGLFSVLSAVALAALIWTYVRAPYVEFWPASSTLALVPLLVMPVAVLLLVGSLRPSNPTMAGPDMVLKGELPVRGFTKITRHPMLWAFSLWAGTHMVANGDVAHWLLAGAILVTAVNGMFSIDRKRAAQFGEQWQVFRQKTSIWPLQAVVQGKVRLKWSDIGIVNLVISAVVYAVFLYGHEKLLGVPVFHP
ncbi:NnrU family protein [Ferrovibrio sp.]|uniref:NnrU family protein n=1 Tax=Ferrovibrio sp. TaxID=1917215 RepID=UPI0025BFE9F2|nr:NnrU family protein [Ferrovibrio sp.]